uniref:CD276 molecule n=1 Tax=Zosterops lateralis melanops TaxID=1220523 RepID=A0A8D2QPG4_ZOSLA
CCATPVGTVLELWCHLVPASLTRVPEEPVVALFGHDATLLCSFSPELTDTKRLGRGYANRTSLFYDQLALGNVSLLLRRVQIDDEGSFTCFVRVRDYDSAAVTLQVPSKDLKPGDVAMVTCHASRGYPEASVLWQDSRGTNLTDNVTTSQVANEEGLFEVRSVLTVLVEPGVTYSCLVLNAVLRQHGHASVTITGECPGTGGHTEPAWRAGGGDTGTQSRPGRLEEVTVVTPAPRAGLEGWRR